MVTKAAPKTTAPSTSGPTSTTPSAPSVVSAAPVPSPAAPDAAAPPSAPSSHDPSFAVGAAYETAVQNLIEMGFEREQVKAAMKAAFNNADRAVEYLMTGIPDHIARDMAASSAPPTTAPATAPVAPTPSVATTGPVNLFEAAAQATRTPAGGTTPGVPDPNALSFLRNSPQFQQLRQLAQTQPQLLQPVLQQLGQSNPQLFQLISENQDAFLQLLLEGAGEGDFEGDEEGVPPGAQVINITTEENAAIERLTALGFERSLAIEAFFACDKNEELAANYLFDSSGQGDF